DAALIMRDWIQPRISYQSETSVVASNESVKDLTLVEILLNKTEFQQELDPGKEEFLNLHLIRKNEKQVFW
ncbi:10110_t:CDS:2, partial [Paraglomus brasilianum]